MSEGEPGEAKWRENDPEQMIRDGNDDAHVRSAKLTSCDQVSFCIPFLADEIYLCGWFEKAGEGRGQKMIWFAPQWAFAITVGKEPPIIC